MRPALHVALSSALLLGVSPVSAAAPVPAKRTFTVTGFDRIELGGAYLAEIRVGPGASVRAEGDRDSLDGMQVEVRGTRLLIRPSRVDWRADRGEGPVTVRVTLPALRGATVVGAGRMTVDRARGTDFAAGVTGPGALEVGDVEAERVTMTLAGPGKLRVAGKTTTLRVAMEGAGAIDAAALAVQSLTATVSGAADLRATAARDATVTVAGTANVRITGKARCKVTQMGAGTVQCGD